MNGPWHRYVAIGDSTTEGLDDRDESGRYRGWADRLAEHIAAHQGALEYANLAVRGRQAAHIRDEQLPQALELAPDLVTVVAGMNDLLGAVFDPVAIAREVESMMMAFDGATVLTFTLPDPTPNLPLPAVFGPRLTAFNKQLRQAAARAGAIMVDVARYPSASDPRLWSDDRLHGNSKGHEIVGWALAHGLGLPGFDDSWRVPLPATSPATSPAPPGQSVWAELAWAQQHALPWLWRSVRGRSAGDGLGPKRPEPVRIGP